MSDIRIEKLKVFPDNKWVLPVLKAGLLYNRLLNTTEQAFIYGLASLYAQFGNKIVASEKQLTVLADIANKLNIPA